LKSETTGDEQVNVLLIKSCYLWFLCSNNCLDFLLILGLKVNLPSSSLNCCSLNCLICSIF